MIMIRTSVTSMKNKRSSKSLQRGMKRKRKRKRRLSGNAWRLSGEPPRRLMLGRGLKRSDCAYNMKLRRNVTGSQQRLQRQNVVGRRNGR